MCVCVCAVCVCVCVCVFSVNAVKLFNALPKQIRNITECPVDAFKSQLDKFLDTVPDEPQITGMPMYRRAEPNSIVDMLLLRTLYYFVVVSII